MIKTFEELERWKKAASLRREVGELVKQFPQEEKYRLTDQLIRASRSATANIAEGYGRFHYQENIQFCRQSRGSLFEILDHLIVATESGFISESELANYRSKIKECLAILNGYINYLKRAKSETNLASEPETEYRTPTDELMPDNH